MNNRSHIRLWSMLVAAILFAAAFLTVHFVMNPRETETASAELNALLDTAEARAEADADALTALDEAADAAAIHKARTVARFLAHDDTLMETDALLVLCELTDVSLITVADMDGNVIAASDAALIGSGYAADADMAWAMTTLDENAAPAAQTAGGTERMAAAPRTDIEGFVLVRDENALFTGIGAGDIHKAVENLALSPDTIQLVETVGENGVFEQNGMLYVQRAESTVTLIASRPLSAVHAVQYALLTALAIFAGASIAALFIWQLTGDRGRTADAETEPDAFTSDESATENYFDDMPEEEPYSKPERPKTKRRRHRNPFIEIEEIDDDDDDDRFFGLEPERPAAKSSKRKRTLRQEETPEADAAETAPESASKPPKKGPRSVKRTHSPEDDDSFDKIFE